MPTGSRSAGASRSPALPPSADDRARVSGPLSPELVARYLAAEANAEERAIVEGWAAADPANASDLEHMRGVFAARPPRHLWDADKPPPASALRAERARSLATMQKQRAGRARLTRIVSLVVGLGALGAAWHFFGPERGPPPTVHATGLGETRHVELPDGSRVTLAPQSELRVDGRYAQANRRVDLIGEGYFDVRPDTAQPFQVYALGTITEETGTEFAVRAIAADSVVSVVVTAGSASLRLADAPLSEGVALRPRDAAWLDARTLRARVRREVNADAMVAWRSGRLDYVDAPLTDVAADLARWYGFATQFASVDVAARTASFTVQIADTAGALRNLGRWGQVERRGDSLFVR